MAGYKKETPQWLKEELIAIYTDSNLSLDQREAQMSKVYNETLNKNTSSRTLVRLTQKWKAKKQLQEQIGDKSPELDVHTLTGITVQRDSEGKVVQYWTKTKPEVNQMYEQILEAINNIKPFEYVVEKLEVNDDLMLEIPLLDMHFGVSWWEDYKFVQAEIIDYIKLRKRKKIVIPMGQDMFHNNDLKGNTSNGTPIEKVDMLRCLEDAKRFWIPIIIESSKNAEEIEIIYSRGNHDETSSFIFVWALKQIFSEYTNVIFDMGYEDVKGRLFGKCLVAWMHGDKGRKRGNKVVDARGQIMSLFRQEFFTARVVEIHSGHEHTEKEFGDQYGILLRRLPTKNKEDEWSVDEGYVGNHKRFQLFEWTTKKLKGTYYV